jgi:hypothetical protein
MALLDAMYDAMPQDPLDLAYEETLTEEPAGFYEEWRQQRSA